uniref:Uncharacterized protein n=1 Tax=Anguilla anguilla TaxID=7936 RepID=A0A0E9RT14_ANGAN
MLGKSPGPWGYSHRILQQIQTDRAAELVLIQKTCSLCHFTAKKRRLVLVQNAVKSL